MLTDQVKELLTAFVDGELSPRQRKAVTRLLHRSSEARELLRQLQENAHRIKQLPHRNVEPSLVDDILQAIAEQQVQPRQLAAPKVARRRWMPYVAASLAASLLIATLGIVWWTNRGDVEGVNREIAKSGDRKPEPKTLPERDPIPMPPPLRQPNKLLANLIEGTVHDFGAVIPVEKAFAASFSEFKNDKTGVTSRLMNELDRVKVVQLDITVKNNAMAMSQLKGVLQERGIKIVVDPDADKSLTSKAKVEYLVYAENLSSEEVGKMMAALSEPVVVGQKNTQRIEPTSYQKVKASPIARDDKQKLARMLGVEASTMEPKDRKGVKPEPKVDRQAVVLPTNAGGSLSREVREFASQRRPQPGTIQVLLKIRQE